MDKNDNPIPDNKLSFAKTEESTNLENKKDSKDQNENIENNKSVQKKPKKSSKKLIFGFFIFAGLLFGAFYLILLFGLITGGVSNPLFETLGLESNQLKNVLFTLTNFIFGFFSLFFLIAALIKLFQYMVTAKDAANRKAYAVKSGIFGSIFFMGVLAWIGIYWLIANADAQKVIVDENMIITNPQNVIGLDAPAEVSFDIGDKLYSKIDKNNIRQINWDFDGDGSVDASGPNVIYRFLDKGDNNGRYPVKVTVYYFSPADNEEKEFSTSREVIIQNEAVRGVITANPDGGPVPLKVEFSAEESKDPDGQVVLYEWDMNDDGIYEITGSDKTLVSKTFNQIGEFTVRLRVTGQNNDFNIVEKTITITGPEENLRAEISSSDKLEGFSPLEISLDGANSFVRHGKIVRYEWQIQGEEKVVVGRRINRTFREPGEYEISLVVENDLGERHKTTEIIKVLEEEKTANLKIRTTPGLNQSGRLQGSVPFKVVFDSAPSDVNEAVEWMWDFENDGIFDGFGKSVEHVFRESGIYDVKLQITDSEDNSFESFQKVFVEGIGIQAKISADPASGNVPLRILFDGSGSIADNGEIIDYIWEFPNTEPIHYGAKISREFKTIGVFPVKLTILTSTGKMSETNTLISVRSQALKASFNATPQNGSAPLRVAFNPSLSTGTIVKYIWEFGDGEVSQKFKPEHVFRDAGEYDVKLVIEDVQGVVSEMTKTIRVLE